MKNTGKSPDDKRLRKNSVSLQRQSKGLNRFNLIVERKLKRLNQLLSEQDMKCWQIGDLCIDLLDNHHLSLRQVADQTVYTRARISHFHLTARAFPPKQRNGHTFQDSLTARQIWLRLPRLKMSPIEIRQIIEKLKNKTPKQVRGHFVQMLLEKEMNQSLAGSVEVGLKGVGLINNCYHADWRKIVPKLPDQSVKLFIADPPFGVYKDENDGVYYSARSETSGMRADCDHGSGEAALAVTLPLFELCLPKLAPDGVLLLFQPGAKADRIEILQAAEKYGWQCRYVLTWLKGNIKNGNRTNPYGVCSEKILVFTRKGENVNKHQNGLTSPDILDYPTETLHATIRMDFGKIAMGDYHIFQKPPSLMEFLIKQHTYPGELVCTPFGCSGVGVMAAAKLRRKWVYIESNRNNYLWGSQRIRQNLTEMSIQVG